MPTEDTLFSYKVLDQTVKLDLKELECKNPNMGTIDELMKRIMEGPPGMDIDKSWIEGDDPLMKRLSGGAPLMSLPTSFQEKDFSIKDWLIDDATDAGADGLAVPVKPSAESPKKGEEEGAAFDVGQIGKARSEKEIALNQLVDKMKEAITGAKEKLHECSGPEADALLQDSPSVKSMRQLLALRLKLLCSCLPGKDRGEGQACKEEVTREIAGQGGVPPGHVCRDLKGLKAIDELATLLTSMGESSTTGTELATAVNEFSERVEPLRTLVQTTKLQKDRLHAATNSAKKQRAKSIAPKDKAKPGGKGERKRRDQQALLGVPLRFSW